MSGLENSGDVSNSGSDAGGEAFLKLMMQMNAKLTNITTSIATSEANIENKIADSEAKVIEHIDTKYKELSEQILGLENRISALEEERDLQRKQILELERESAAKSSQIVSLEMKVNQCNIILFNFEENEITPEELLTNLITFFKEVMKVIMSHTDVDVIYRLGKPNPRKIRPVFVSLTTLKMRDYIFSCRRNLKGSKVSISEDCPKEIIERRKQLLPALLGAKKLKQRAFFKYGSLVVNGSVCSDEDIGKYSRAYAESSKRGRSIEEASPTGNPGTEVKKPRPNLKGLKSSSRQRRSSVGNLATPPRPITSFFNQTTTDSPNSKIIYVQSEK